MKIYFEYEKYILNNNKTDTKVQETISKHVVKTVCSDVVNDMVRFIAFEQLQIVQSSQEALNNEVINEYFSIFFMFTLVHIIMSGLILTLKTLKELILMILLKFLQKGRTKLIQKFKDPFKQKFAELNQGLTNKV